MEDDPWATGPSWSAPAQASSSSPRLSPPRPGASGPLPQPTFSPPPPQTGFDVSDPWGAPPKSPVVVKRLPGEEQVQEPKRGWSGEEDSGWGKGDVEPPGIIPQFNDQAAPTSPIAVAQEEEPRWRSSPEDSKRPLPSEPEAEQEESQLSPSSHASPQHDIPTFDLSPATHNEDRSPSPKAGIPDLPDFDLEAGFAVSLPGPTMPKSPSFGDEGFGGFSAGFSNGEDPWGSGVGGFGAGDDWGGNQDTSRRLSAGQQSTTADDEEEGAGWGGVRAPRMDSAPVKSTDETDWEDAQRRMRAKQDRAPQEKIDKLLAEWKEVVLSNIGANQLKSTTEDESRALGDAVRKLESETWETLRSLSGIPSDINTYPPVISSLVTHERHAYALTRPNPTPSTSLIHLSATRRPKRVEALTSNSPWLSRSKLGEPDAPVSEEVQSPNSDAGSSKWSFWGRKQPERPLVTSGGGILEVKQMASPTAVAARPSAELRSISSKPPSFTSKNSRPSSPAPSLPPTSASVSSFDDLGHAAPSGIIESTSTSYIATGAAPAPSAVSRFWGRLSRKPSNTPRPQDQAGDARDLELSSDDFSFLSEVPSMTSPPPGQGVGDLLAMETGRTEEMASLESMLSSKPAILPAPLAPPPKGPVAPAYSRTASSSSNRFVPKMRPPAQASDMDLLGGLDFSGDSGSFNATPAQAPTPPAQQAKTASTSMWDDFLAPAPSFTPPQPAVTRTMTPSIQPQPSQSPLARPVQPMVPSPAPRPTPAPQASTSLAPPSSFDDFDDFGTPQHASNARFDDFGDFSAFDTPPPALPSKPTSKIAPTKLPLDHTHTASLVSDASASKGQRWPAPASPIGPILEPPPKSAPATAFPFLSPPPPPSRPTSGLGRNVDLLAGDEPAKASTLANGSTSGFQAQMAAMSLSPPQMTKPTGPISPNPTSAPMTAGNSTQSQGGLSAQDLSFFDGL